MSQVPAFIVRGRKLPVSVVRLWLCLLHRKSVKDDSTQKTNWHNIFFPRFISEQFNSITSEEYTKERVKSWQLSSRILVRIISY